MNIRTILRKYSIVYTSQGFIQDLSWPVGKKVIIVEIQILAQFGLWGIMI